MRAVVRTDANFSSPTQHSDPPVLTPAPSVVKRVTSILETVFAMRQALMVLALLACASAGRGDELADLAVSKAPDEALFELSRFELSSQADAVDAAPNTDGSLLVDEASVLDDDEPWLAQDGAYGECCRGNGGRGWQLLPKGLIYKSYLAGVKESRIGSVWHNEKTLGAQWDVTLGGRVGLLRCGSYGGCYPQGWQLDVEGAAFPRLDLVDNRRDLTSVDFRFGIPLTYGVGRYQMKFAYYHLSSHLGDEFLARVPTAVRINFTRDVFVWGHSYYWTDWLRIYGEAGWSYQIDGGTEPWEFQFGMEYAPPCATGFHGAPFWAVNTHLREEVDFSGNFVAQAGWAWRSTAGGPLLRAGVQYYNGKSPQYEFFNTSEEQIGAGLWYDY